MMDLRMLATMLLVALVGPVDLPTVSSNQLSIPVSLSPWAAHVALGSEENDRPRAGDQSSSEKASIVAEDTAPKSPDDPAVAEDDPKTKHRPIAPARRAAEQLLADVELPRDLRNAMMTVLRQHPRETRWSGRSGQVLFAVATRRLPPGRLFRSRALPAQLRIALLQATAELLQADSLLARYADQGLTDATTVRQAVLQASGRLHVTGGVRGLLEQAAARGDFAVALVRAEESEITTSLFQPTALNEVKSSYREVMHGKIRDLMKRQDWEDAVLLWTHLHERKLVSEQLYLDAAQCYKELGRPQDMIDNLAEAIDTLRDKAQLEFFERVGNLALDVQREDAQTLAEQAFAMALQEIQKSPRRLRVSAKEP